MGFISVRPCPRVVDLTLSLCPHPPGSCAWACDGSWVSQASVAPSPGRCFGLGQLLGATAPWCELPGLRRAPPTGAQSQVFACRLPFILERIFPGDVVTYPMPTCQPTIFSRCPDPPISRLLLKLVLPSGIFLPSLTGFKLFFSFMASTETAPFVSEAGTLVPLACYSFVPRKEDDLSELKAWLGFSCLLSEPAAHRTGAESVEAGSSRHPGRQDKQKAFHFLQSVCPEVLW